MAAFLMPQLQESVQATTYVPPKPPTLLEQINNPTLYAIATCESNLTQFVNGKVLVSRTSDKGIFQINWVHWQEATGLGFNLNTLDGNIKFAKYLYAKNGTSDWRPSRGCWKPKIASLSNSGRPS